MTPLAECPRGLLAGVAGVLTDIDETVSTHGRLTAEAYEAMAALHAAGLRLIPVTGRPAGWCDHIARFWPVDAVVGENGAFWMWQDRRAGKLKTRFIQSEAERTEGRRRLEAVREQVRRDVPGAGIASDQPYRVADLAIEFGSFTRKYAETRNPNIEIANPVEGQAVAMNVACITVGTKNQKLAEEWINFHLSEPCMLAYARETYYSPTVKGLNIPDELQAKLVLGPDADRLVDFDWDVVTRSQAAWSSRFNREIAG